jgi:large subunit ribosomal protein L16
VLDLQKGGRRRLRAASAATPHLEETNHAALAPARTKYRKSQKGSRAGNAKRGNTLAFGEFGLQSLTRGPMTGQQIEAARVTISRHLKRKGKLWIRIFPHKPVTKKPAEVRMGQGKGPVEFYVAVIKPGAVLFELAGVPRVAKEAFRLADAKLPFHCRFIVREGTVI